MGSPDPAIIPDNFNDTKIRINSSFEYLRKEMKEIQRQDIILLKQLMHIRHTILLLSNYPDRRSYSFNSLDPSINALTSPNMSQWRRPSLTRVQSAPLERNVSEDTIPEEGDDEGEEDEFAQSFNSTASDSKVICNIVPPSPDTDFIYALAPLPPVFRRLLESTAPPHGCSDQPNSVVHTQTLLRDLNRNYTGCYDNSLRRYVTTNKLLHRQSQVDEAETSLGKLKQRSSEEGDMFIGRTGSLRLSPQTSTEIEI